MAKKSVLERNSKRKILGERFALKRQELKNKIKDPSLNIKEKLLLIQKLDNLPVDSSKVRYRNRCAITGRGRGFYNKFGVSRIMMREFIHFIPGLKKASW
ncbi:30S ribosomal protein S14 [Alphaproteobacteria bacterium endosymbiont of Tiliacea citrago]|uniref:30S ribosomal protein S14 n=1 Tax=Alphaproteobacteria bacterium endosymbiont of Tiliacea citrago TaxID=3077944 RepID=UPI00313E00A9